MSDADNLKAKAAAQAAGYVRSGMVVGLGTGTTAAFALRAIAARLAAGDVRDIVGIPTAIRTRELALELGIPISTLNDHPRVDLTIDGADEVDPQGNMIKGGGGALLWEKIVAKATDRYVIIVDPSKLVDRLGQRSHLPVEVATFGWATHLDAVRSLGGEPVLRTLGGRAPFSTDGTNYLLDCHFPNGIEDPECVHRVLRDRPGVMETGLFLGMSPEVIVGR